MLGDVLADCSVLSSWSVLDLDLEEETERSLLKMIADLWIAIRRFSFASGWMEQYKQLHHKQLPKSKALCSDLCSKRSYYLTVVKLLYMCVNNNSCKMFDPKDYEGKLMV